MVRTTSLKQYKKLRERGINCELVSRSELNPDKVKTNSERYHEKRRAKYANSVKPKSSNPAVNAYRKMLEDRV